MNRAQAAAEARKLRDLTDAIYLMANNAKILVRYKNELRRIANGLVDIESTLRIAGELPPVADEPVTK